MDATYYNTDHMLYPMVAKDLPADRLRELRQELGLSLRDVVKLSEGGISHAHISHLERDPAAWSKASHGKLLALARAYNMSLDKFLSRVNGTPYPTKPNIYTDQVTLESNSLQGRRMIPEYDMVGMGPGGGDGNIIGYVDVPNSWPGEYKAFRVHGDSMLPKIEDGTTVVIRVQESASPNNVIVCWTPDEGMLCKFLREIRDDGTHVLTSFNPDYPPIWAKDIYIYGVLKETRTEWRIVNGVHS